MHLFSAAARRSLVIASDTGEDVDLPETEVRFQHCEVRTVARREARSRSPREAHEWNAIAARND